MLVIAGGREARAGLDVDVGRAQDLTADRAVRLDVRDLTARVVAVESRRPGIAHGSTITPGDHRHQHVDELRSHSGQHVLAPGRVLRVGAALEHPGLDQVPEGSQET